MEAEREFRAMGSFAHVLVVGGRPGLVAEAERRIADLEQRWSRFLPTSEVSALNRLAGAAVEVSADTLLLVSRAVEGWRLSGGAFDPTVLGPMIRAGYDRSFDEVRADPAPGRSELDLGAAAIEVGTTTARIPAGAGFDPGGIGKGLAADVVCEELLAAGAAGVCVNLGGDVRVAGEGPAGGTWTVAVEHEWDAEPVALLGLVGGAVATSTTLRRRWRTPDGISHHHLIDPQTGLPSTTDLTLATVVAGTAWMAEVLAKAVLLRGRATAFDILGGTGAEGLIVDAAGGVETTPGLAGFLDPSPLQGGRALLTR